MSLSQRISIISFSLLAIIFAFFAFALPTHAATVTVTTSDFYGADGCGLQEAVATLENQLPEPGCVVDENNPYGDTDTIIFDISGDGPHVINADNRLLFFSIPIIIDGTSQSGVACDATDNFSNRDIRIQIQNFQEIAFLAGSDGSVVRGLSILSDAAPTRLLLIDGTSDITLDCNYIGLDATGNSGYANGDRPRVLEIIDSSNIMIGGNTHSLGNVIAGSDVDNFTEAILLTDVSHVTIQNNRIGMGAGENPNRFSSAQEHIEICGPDTCDGGYPVSSHVHILDNEIFVDGHNALSLTGDSLVISGNTIDAINMDELPVVLIKDTLGVALENNQVTAKGDQVWVFEIDISSNVDFGNNEITVQGNGSRGVYFSTSATNIDIYNNIINTQGVSRGINIQDGETFTISGNTISSSGILFGDQVGIMISDSSEGEITENTISGFATGITISSPSFDVWIHHNILAGNTFGISLIHFPDTPAPPSNNITILENSIYGGVGFEVPGFLKVDSGISIEMFNITGDPEVNNFNPAAWEHFGPNVNDPFDADTGPNNFQNWPEIISTTDNGDGTVSVEFTTDFQPGEYRIEFFRNSIFPESGHGEGEEFIGHINIEHAGEGPQTFTIDLPLSAGQHIASTATVIDEDNHWGFGPTSEFGNSFTVFFVAPPTPTPRQSSGGSIQQRISNLVDMGKEQEANQLKDQFPHLFETEQTQEQKIQSLLAQIQQLQTLLAQLTNNTPSSQTLVCTPALRRGDTRRDQVSLLQQKLGITADGLFGPNTEQSVRTFQQQNNFSVDGIAGNQTCSALSQV